jgi:transposase-like protein
MKRRQWTAEQKLQIVLEGLKNQGKLSDLCSRYEIGQVQYYKWRDQLLKHGTKAFEGTPEKEKERLEKKVQKLTTLVGQLTVELKKTELELL